LAIYSINDLEKLSGIKAHTLRIWEQRYGIISPQRTPTNIRYYTDTELRRLLNISLLNKHGYKISRIADMSDTLIDTCVAQISQRDSTTETHIDTLAMAMIEMDELKFEQIVGTSISDTGFEHTMLDVIFPFLEKINLLYLTGAIKPAQEHFITALIRQKIIVAIDTIPLTTRVGALKFLIFLPEGERQELSLLYLHFLLKLHGFYVINIGGNLPIDDVKVAYELHQPQFVYTLFTEPHKVPTEQRVRAMATMFANSQLLLSGYQIINKPIAITENIRILKTLVETTLFLKGLQEA
jgi:MerR family transcriptional regulator, light-induced transcriptional regulator